ncbi:MAG: ribonuclease Y [Bacilli bacterium]|nr:ribonuclease Y [Bacilli bacterium]
MYFLSINEVVLPLIVGILCLIVGLLVARFIPFLGIKDAQKKSKKIIKEAENKAEQITRSAQVEGKTLVYELKVEAEKEIKEKKKEVTDYENKLTQREQNIDRRDLALQSKEDNLDLKNEQLNKRLTDIDKKEAELNQKIDSIIVELERVASLSTTEAKNELFKRVEEKMAQEVASYIKNKEEEAREVANDKARELLGLAVQKYSQEVASEKTVSVVSLPSDDLKGRIIGREGRNIRALEQLTGADLIIDDTPEVITISCFDPIRRETARLSLEYLIKDGRIQPGRIEEIVEKVKAEIDESVKKAGEEALFKLGISRINREFVTYIGKLKYRTSYGQNALQHSMEVAYLAGIMAAELGLDQNLARRAGLLHDIGKSVDYEMEGSHIEIGARLAKKYGEPQVVINAIESHHGDVPADNVISNLVAAADTLSAARPGARSETLENYIKRIEQLEEISKSFEGVASAYAIQAGREIRIMVAPDKVDDIKAFKLARDIREKIENELTYPGQIKVTVVREVRANELAK